VVGPQRPPIPQARGEFAAIIARVLEPEAEELNWPPERVAHLLRLLSFSSAFPALNEGIEFSIDELATMTLVGIAGSSPHLGSPFSLGPLIRTSTPSIPTEASCS
jgi:hypothetical protein